jgi:hypothetical protein
MLQNVIRNLEYSLFHIGTARQRFQDEKEAVYKDQLFCGTGRLTTGRFTVYTYLHIF